jgi:hypothetical protein
MLARPSRLLLVRPRLLLLLLCLRLLLLVLLRLRVLLLLLLVVSLLPLARVPPWVLVSRRVVLGWQPPNTQPGLRLCWRMLWLRLLWSSRPVQLADGARVWPLPRLLRLLPCLLRPLRWLRLLPRLLRPLYWPRLLLRLWRPLSRSLQCRRRRIRAHSAPWLHLLFLLCCLFLLGCTRLLARLGHLRRATIPSPFPSVWVLLLRLVRRHLTLHRHTQPWRLCLLLLLVLPRALPRCNIIPGMATPRWGLGQGILLVLRHRLAAFSRLWALLPRIRPRLVLRYLLPRLLLLLLQQLQTRRTTTLCLFAAVARAVLVLLLLLLPLAPLLMWSSSMTTTMMMRGLVRGPPVALAARRCLARCALLFLLLPWLRVSGPATTRCAPLARKRFVFLRSS